MVFGNRNLVIHLARGVGGFGALAGSLATMNHEVWPSLVLMPAALFLLRGCPVCWTVGLVETVVMRMHERAADT